MRCEYISEDGKFRSEDEDAVNAYELSVFIKDTGIVWTDDAGETCELEDATYMLVPSELSMSRVRAKLYEQYGIELDTGLQPGSLYYDIRLDQWVNIDDRIAELTADIADLKEIKDRLEQKQKELNDVQK